MSLTRLNTRMDVPPTSPAQATFTSRTGCAGAWAARADDRVSEEGRAGMSPHGRGPGSVDRGEKATGSAIEAEPSVLPGCALTESGQSLHLAPDGPGVRLVLLCERVRLGGVLLRHVESLHDRLKDRFARRTEFLGGRPQDRGALEDGIGVEGGADVIERCGP